MATDTHLFKELDFFPMMPTIVRAITKKEFNEIKKEARKSSKTKEEYATKLNDILIGLRSKYSQNVPGIINKEEQSIKSNQNKISLDSISQDDFLDTRDYGIQFGKEIKQDYPNKLEQMILITYILNYLKITPNDFKSVDWEHPHLELPPDMHSDNYDDESDDE